MAKRAASDFFAPKAKVAKSERPFFCLAPSAGGTPPKEVLEVLREIGTVHFIEGWSGMIFDSAANVGKVLTLLRGASAAAEETGAKVFLVGTSFGCRVMVEVLTKHAAELPCCVVSDSLLALGFPLFGPNAASDRATPLLALPPTCRVTFVSGDKDEFLSRDYMAEKGPAALAAVVGRMQAQATVVVVSGGKHNPLGVGKKAFLKAKATFVDAVQKHVAAAAAATTATTTARSSSSEK